MEALVLAALLEAQKKAIQYFMGDGFGDDLFLKQTPDGKTFAEPVFEFLHEGPRVFLTISKRSSD